MVNAIIPPKQCNVYIWPLLTNDDDNKRLRTSREIIFYHKCLGFDICRTFFTKYRTLGGCKLKVVLLAFKPFIYKNCHSKFTSLGKTNLITGVYICQLFTQTIMESI